MTESTSKQRAEYEEWLKENPDSVLPTETQKILRDEISDVLEEDKQTELKREEWRNNRAYNSKNIPRIARRGIMEEEK